MGILSPGAKIPRVGGKIPQSIFTPGGQVAQGVKINCYTGKMYHAFTFSWSPHAVSVSVGFLFICQSSRDENNTAVGCQIAEVVPTVCPCSAGFLVRLYGRESKSPYSLWWW